MTLTPNITTIFFSVDHTLRTVTPDPAAASAAASGILRLLQTRETWESLSARLSDRWDAYRVQADSTLLETGDQELWCRHLLPEYEPNMVCAVAASLSRLWLSREGRRDIRPGTAEILRRLNRRGYTLCILENTPSEDELPEWLVTEGLASCFHTVLLSSKIRLRKPDPAAYRLAARCAAAPVGECAFVGGYADLAGAASAAFGMAVLLDDGMPPGGAYRAGGPGGTGTPRAFVSAESIEDLPGLFPDRREIE